MAEDGRPFLRVPVTDEGPGSARRREVPDRDALPEISGSEAVPGTVGLTVVQKVLQAHRGRLDVANNEGGPVDVHALDSALKRELQRERELLR